MIDTVVLCFWLASAIVFVVEYISRPRGGPPTIIGALSAGVYIGGIVYAILRAAGVIEL